MQQNIVDLKTLQEIGRLELIARFVVEGFITGLHRSPYHGFSVEFAEHRQYNPGESTRHIDWKLYGRSEKLFVKRFEEETNLRCQLVIDTSSSMYYPELSESKSGQNKISFAIIASAALIYLLKQQRDAVGLSLFDENIRLQTKSRSSSIHHRLLFTELEKLLANKAIEKKTFASESLHRIAENINKRSLVIIFSDMMDNSEHADDIFNALQHLRHCKHEVILFHLVDKKKELDFGFSNRPMKFKDLETGQEVKLNPSRIRDNYIKAAAEYKTKLKLRAAQFAIDFVEADIHEGFRNILLPYLMKREKLY